MTKHYWTFEGKEVTQRIADGLTTIFNCQFQAEEFAKQKRSYHYPLYSSPHKSKVIAWGVPK